MAMIIMAVKMMMMKRKKITMSVLRGNIEFQAICAYLKLK
jgi:hypothetical protein